MKLGVKRTILSALSDYSNSYHQFRFNIQNSNSCISKERMNSSILNTFLVAGLFFFSKAGDLFLFCLFCFSHAMRKRGI